MCLKSIIKCLYQLVFKFSQFSGSKLTYLLNYCRFCDFYPFRGQFLDILHTLKLNKSDLTSIMCLKCIIKCLYQLVFKFSQFLDLKLTYFMNYCRFCDFDPSLGHFSALGHYCSPFKDKYKNFGIYIVVEMHYKMFVLISFQV